MSAFPAVAEETLNSEFAKTRRSPEECDLANIDFNNLSLTSGDITLKMATYTQLNATFPVSHELYESSILKLVATTALPALSSGSHKERACLTTQLRS